MGKIGVIIANTGSPKSPDPADVRVYLRQFLSNDRIVMMNKTLWNIILNVCILPTRSKKSGKKYEGVWHDGGFDFIRDHEKLAEMLQARYEALGKDVCVLSAMSFGEPTIPDAMRRLQVAACDELVVLPLYPQNAFSQASIVEDEVKRCARATGWESNYRVVGDYSANPAYLDAVTRSVRDAGFNSAKDRLLFSFHSVPRGDIDAGDSYEKNVHATCKALAERLCIDRKVWRLAFQSRFDKARDWVSPFTNEVLASLAQEREISNGRLFVVCPNFSVDCLETYYDVMQVMRDDWIAMSGMPRDSFVYVPCLGASEAHVKVIMNVLDLQ